MTYRLSNRQYVLLEMAKERFLALDELVKYSQVTAGSVVLRRLMDYDPRHKGFGLTAEGRSCMQAFESTDISRKNPANPVSKHIQGEISAASRRKPTFKRDRVA
jgi:hypothetical protein